MNFALKKRDFIFKDEPVEILLKDEVKIDFDGDFLVNGNQIGIILGYKRSRDAIDSHVYENDKFIVKNADISIKNSDAVKHRFRKLNNRGETFLNESGMYALIFGSKLKESKEFKHWVTSKLLPTIRKTGGYIGSTKKFVDYHFQEYDEEIRILMIEMLRKQDDQRKEIKKQQETIKVQQPKVEQHDTYMAIDDEKSIKEIGHLLGIGQNKLFRFLRDQNILMDKKGSHYWNKPYQKHIDAGHFVVKPIVYKRGEEDRSYDKTLVTKKGLNYIFKKITKLDMLDELRGKR